VRGQGGLPTLGGHRCSLGVLHAFPFDACFLTQGILLLAGGRDNEERFAQGEQVLANHVHDNRKRMRGLAVLDCGSVIGSARA
jgi:hypothetical protein